MLMENNKEIANLFKKACCSKLFSSMPLIFLSACVSSGEMLTGYQSTVNTFANVLDGQGLEWSDTRINLGPIYVATIPLDADPTPDWKRLGTIIPCGSDLCLKTPGAAPPSQLNSINSRAGASVGLGDAGLAQSWFIDGHPLLSGVAQERTLGAWYQYSEQIPKATRNYQTLANIISRSQKNINTANANNRISEITSALETLSAAAVAYNSGQVTQQQQQVSQGRQRAAIEQNRQGEITIQQRERDQAAFDQRQQERRLQIEREMQLDIARRAEERRQLDAYRQRLPGGSNQGGDLSNCRTRELGCTGNGYCPPLCPGE